MTERQKRITIYALILLILLLLLGWLLFILFSGGGESSEVTDETVVIEEVADPIPERTTISEEELEAEREVRDTSSDVISLSKTFVERYGSYSNEADFSNLEDLIPLMSDSFAAETELFIDGAVAPEEYYGVSTQVITVSVEGETDSAATVTLTTQREEAVESPQNTTVKYQDIQLTFVKEGGVWKIDSATWL